MRRADLEYSTIERVIDVNLYGTIHMVKAFLPHLRERPIAHIANAASMGAYLPAPGQTVYGASKAGVKLLTEGLCAELLDTAVGVSVIMPGAIRTDISANSGLDTPTGESADDNRVPTTAPDDAARIILDGIAADRLHIYVGGDARLMNLASRVAPSRATHLIYRKVKSLLGP